MPYDLREDARGPAGEWVWIAVWKCAACGRVSSANVLVENPLRPHARGRAIRKTEEVLGEWVCGCGGRDAVPRDRGLRELPGGRGWRAPLAWPDDYLAALALEVIEANRLDGVDPDSISSKFFRLEIEAAHSKRGPTGVVFLAPARLLGEPTLSQPRRVVPPDWTYVQIERVEGAIRRLLRDRLAGKERQP